MGHWRQPMLLFILPKKPQEMNDFSSFLAVFFYGLMSQSLFIVETNLFGRFCWILPQAIPDADFSDQIFWLQRIGFDFFANV